MTLTPPRTRAESEIKVWEQNLARHTNDLRDDFTAHVADTTTHGTTGDIVGDSDTQTISNKIMDSSNKYGGVTNYSSFETDGTLVFNGDATVWEDLRIEPIVRNTVTTNNPAINAYRSTGVRLYEFDDAVAAQEKEVHFQVQMPHAWDGTVVYPHLHILPIGATGVATENIAIEFEYAWTDIGQLMDAPTAATTTFDPTNASLVYPAEATTWVQYKHYIMSLPAITPSATQDGISSILIGKIRRKSGNANDTYNSKAFALLYIDFHYAVNTCGSRSVFTK